ncbi:MAG TPA: peroxiredoxin [Candidatus Atribacteria bacterium]|nr:peroxiredoxin [Candidatus Atribacteria bacterium]HCU23085.1 peroxiredoxin [Candidatus Atribacteria bacterium]
MLNRTAQAIWEGNLKNGRGTVEFGGGAFKGNYSFTSRFENGKGTNPEELIAAAHSGCFAMALSNMLAEAGYTPQQVAVTAKVSLEMVDGGFKITASHLDCTAKVPGISQEKFLSIADEAKKGCPVSVLLSNIQITLDAHLEN